MDFYHNRTNPKTNPPADPPHPRCVLLAGAGVVGRAILAEHLRCGFRVLLCDLSPAALQRAAEEATAGDATCQSAPTASPLPGLAAMRLGAGAAEPAEQGDWDPQLLIESIPENLELKREFFAAAAHTLPAACILGSNTSNLRIEDVFARVDDPGRCLGMHFFMPVEDRPLVELIPRAGTSPTTLERCREHAGRLQKESLITGDSPGFVVNRMLVPYLNQALLLLGRGAAPAAVAQAAARFGMPLSPLELIDLIGIRTAFDSGRVFWQAFPKRIDPAPILPGMVKARRLGAAWGGGFFEPAVPDPQPSDPPAPTSSQVFSGQAAATSRPLHPEAAAVIERYQRDARRWTEEELVASLSLPMWIEAAEILAAGVVASFAAIEQGLRGGLGYLHPDGFFGFFDRQGGGQILAQLQAAAQRGSLVAPAALCGQLALGTSPSEALQHWVQQQHAAPSGAGGQP